MLMSLPPTDEPGAGILMALDVDALDSTAALLLLPLPFPLTFFPLPLPVTVSGCLSFEDVVVNPPDFGCIERANKSEQSQDAISKIRFACFPCRGFSVSCSRTGGFRKKNSLL
jgi:hypothetical protein